MGDQPGGLRSWKSCGVVSLGCLQGRAFLSLPLSWPCKVFLMQGEMGSGESSLGKNTCCAGLWRPGNVSLFPR